MASLMQCLCHAYLKKSRKMVGRPIVDTTIDTRVLDIIRIKIPYFKGENEWESARRLDPNGPNSGVQ